MSFKTAFIREPEAGKIRSSPFTGTCAGLQLVDVFMELVKVLFHVRVVAPRKLE
jgi:hypothetical protein